LCLMWAGYLAGYIICWDGPTKYPKALAKLHFIEI
jgi:hypothetical protein